MKCKDHTCMRDSRLQSTVFWDAIPNSLLEEDSSLHIFIFQSIPDTS